jgi:hypothetical protein
MRSPPGNAARRANGAHLAVLLLWAGFVAAIQRWPSWEEGVRVQFAADMDVYEVIARAAPGLPDTDVLRAYAQRFPVHWLIGVAHDVTDVPLHTLYRVAAIACIALILVAVHVALTALGLDVRAYALALGVVAASAYPVHYLLAAPGMVSDGIFVLGLSVMLVGFVRGGLRVALAGLALATLGRQSALPVGVAAAVWAAFLPAWRPVRYRAAAAFLVVPGVLYAVLNFASDSFSAPRPAGIDDLTVIGFFTGVRPLADHVGRVVLGIAIPAALVAGAWLRTRGPAPWGPLLVAAAVAGQPLVLGPLANASNEPRLAGMAAPAFAVAAGMLLRGAALGRAETLVCAAAIAAGGLHHRYTIAGLGRNAVWATVELVSAVIVVLVLTAGRRAPRTAPA